MQRSCKNTTHNEENNQLTDINEEQWQELEEKQIKIIFKAVFYLF